MSDQSGNGFYNPARADDRTDRVQRPATPPVTSDDGEQEAVDSYLQYHFPGRFSDGGTFVVD